MLAMFTVNDTEEGYRRLTGALLEIDSQLEEAVERTVRETVEKVSEKTGAIPLAVAWNGKKEERLLENSVGCYAGEFINLYPPGVPVLVPGEQITGEICENIRKWREQGLCVQGIIQKGEELWVPVLKK